MTHRAENNHNGHPWTAEDIPLPDAPPPEADHFDDYMPTPKRTTGLPALDAALEYLRMGFSVIPIQPAGKRPLIKWQDFQTRRATEKEIRQWWAQWPAANVAIVTGSISGVDVVDCDSEDGKAALYEFLPDTLTLPMGRTKKGYHLYFRHSPGLKNEVRAILDCDLRTTGGYVVAPPSGAADGTPYRWIIEPSKAVAPPMPGMLLDILRQASGNGAHDDKRPPTDLSSLDMGVPEGQRDVMLFKEACRLRALGNSEAEAWAILRTFASKCAPPFTEEEALIKLRQAWKYPAGKTTTTATEPQGNPLAELMACAVTEEYCKMLGEEKWGFPNLFIINQITIIIAKSGGGKSTIAFNYVCPWILRNHPDIQILYLDCDSPASDHKKMKTLEQKMGNRFCWLNPVTHGKNAAFLIEKLKEIAAARQRLENKIFILDTLKKFLNLMDKSSAKPFFELLRELISLGATIVLLGHANKYRDKDGNLVFEGVGDIQNDADALIFFERITAPDGQDITTVVDPDKGAKVRGLFDPISFHITLPDRVVTQNKDVVAIPDWGASPKGKKLTDDEIFEILRAYLAGQRDYIKQADLVAALKGTVPYNQLLKVLTATAMPEADATTPGQIIYAVGFRNAKTYTVMRPYP